MSRSVFARGVGTLLPPAIRRIFWRSFYGMLAGLSTRNDLSFGCMNWGYHGPGEDFPDDLGPERFPLQLYLALVRDIDLEGQAVAEISCGRGGGLAEVHARAAPASSVGVDLTPENIALCREHYGGREGLRFVVGDAMELPFEDGSLHALLSVEASHCYPDQGRFLREAARVLRPGGWLLWTDFRCVDELSELYEALGDDFALIVRRDITGNVLAAMERDGERRRALIEASRALLLRRVLTYFAAADGETESVASFRRGERQYFLLQIQRRLGAREGVQSRYRALECPDGIRRI